MAFEVNEIMNNANGHRPTQAGVVEAKSDAMAVEQHFSDLDVSESVDASSPYMPLTTTYTVLKIINHTYRLA
jgi:hypothetical protein